MTDNNNDEDDHLRRSFFVRAIVTATVLIMDGSTEDMNDDEYTSAPSIDMTEDSNSLLLQFQCLGTSDREALIKDFQKLLAPMQLSVEGCTFFLEMNNW